MQTKFKAPLAAACAVIAIAALAIGMAQSTKVATPQVATTDYSSHTLANEMWQAAQDYVLSPVHASTLWEGAGQMSYWLDDYAATSVVGGKPGTLVVTRDFGESEDIDAEVLQSAGAVEIREVTVGFKPFLEDHWTWARFGPDGEPIRDADRLPETGKVHANAAPICFAAAWNSTARSG